MKEPITINKANPLRPAEDFYLLRKEGIEHLEKLSGNICTDFNTHETPIALLEALSYAITDLAYRTGFDMKDLVAPATMTNDSWKNVFYTAKQILPGNPVTLNDFRKLIIDTPGIRNAWIKMSEDVEVPIRVNLPTFDEFTTLLASQKDDPCNDKKKLRLPLVHKDEYMGLNFDRGKIIELNGLYKIIIEFDGDVREEKRKQSVCKQVLRRLHGHRSLCEDFLSVTEANFRDFFLKAEALLREDADPDMVLAEICFQIQDYFTPGIRFYSLAEMLEMGRSSEDIFEGPVLDHGFILDEELEQTDFFRDMRLSDIINRVVDIDGIMAFRNFRVNDKLLPFKPGQPGPFDLDDHCANEKFFDEWIAGLKREKLVGRLNIDDVAAHINDEDEDSSKPTARKALIKLFKGKERVRVNVDRFRKLLKDLKTLDRNRKLKGHVQDFSVPTGVYMDLANFYPVQYTLPATYRVGEDGLPLKDGNTRLVQSLQLKGYLAVFEQIFLDFLAQLGSLNKLFSFGEIDATAFVGKIVDWDPLDPKKLIENINGYLHLFVDAERYIKEIQELNESKETFQRRRNTMLDHLLARFGEQMEEFSTLTKYIYPKNYGSKVIKAKGDLLSDYPAASGDRGKAFNYRLIQECEDCPASEKDEELTHENVSGVQRRVSRLLGFEDFRRITIAPANLKFEYINPPDNTRGRIRLYDEDKMVIMESDEIESKCEDEIMHCFIESGCCADNFVKFPEDKEHVRRKRDPQKGYGFSLINEEGKVIATSRFFKDDKERDAALKKAIEALHVICHIEGMHLIEHILLRPKGDNEEEREGASNVKHELLEICVDKCDRGIIRNSSQKILYRFDITILKGKDCIDGKRWRVDLSRIKDPNKPVLIFRETYKSYDEVVIFIDNLRTYGSDFASYKVFRDETNQAHFFFRLFDELGIEIGESKTCYLKPGTNPATNSKTAIDAEKTDACEGTIWPDAWKEIKDLKEFLSFELDLYCCEDACDHNVDPYSFRVSVVLPCWSKRFRNSSFRKFVERTIQNEMPAHVHARIYWLGVEQMRAFEAAYFEWIIQAACFSIPQIEVVNDLVRVVNGLKNCDQPCREEKPVVIT